MIEIKNVEDLKVLTPESETAALKAGAVYLVTVPPMPMHRIDLICEQLREFGEKSGIRFLVTEEGVKFYELVNRSTGEITT